MSEIDLDELDMLLSSVESDAAVSNTHLKLLRLLLEHLEYLTDHIRALDKKIDELDSDSGGAIIQLMGDVSCCNDQLQNLESQVADIPADPTSDIFDIEIRLDTIEEHLEEKK